MKRRTRSPSSGGDGRITRPPLERTAPVRTWSTLFTPPAPHSAGAAGPADVVQRGMEFAYQVVDEYLRQGQAFARTAAEPPAAGVRSPADMGPLAERMLRYGTELSTMWTEMMGGLAGGAGVGPPGRDRSWRPTPPANHPLRVTVELEARRRTSVALELTATPPRTVKVSPLEGGRRARALPAVTAARAQDGSLRLVVRVPDRQPAGTYVGQLSDAEDGAPLGRLTVRVAS
jgi:hypothetical protein